MLELNGWEHLAQEVLISTPRRFGKTISVSMFAAAMMWGAPSVEISIYSTCKRISQKLLRNCVKFFYEVCKQDLAAAGFKVVRQNMEEIVLRGPGGERDVRVVNSYPSKVGGAGPKSLLARQKSACVLREERTGRDAPQHRTRAAPSASVYTTPVFRAPSRRHVAVRSGSRAQDPTHRDRSAKHQTAELDGGQRSQISF